MLILYLQIIFSIFLRDINVDLVLLFAMTVCVIVSLNKKKKLSSKFAFCVFKKLCFSWEKFIVQQAITDTNAMAIDLFVDFHIFLPIFLSSIS